MTNSDIDARFACARAKIASGEWKRKKLGANVEFMNILRTMAFAGMSSTQIAAELSLEGRVITRNSVIGLCHRAKPPIRLQVTKAGNAATQAARVKTRRLRRGSPDTLSTHYVRLQRAVEAKHLKPQPFYPSNGDASVTRTIRRCQARCTWFGCSDEPMTLGKPYCLKHHIMSGALVR